MCAKARIEWPSSPEVGSLPGRLEARRYVRRPFRSMRKSASLGDGWLMTARMELPERGDTFALARCRSARHELRRARSHGRNMSREFHFITHPDVVIDPALPVPRWPLSPRGRERMQCLLAHGWVRRLGAIWCSEEQKAIDAAGILAGGLGLPFQQMAELGENDRSATGYLPKTEFEAMADDFFAQPKQSVRGWERAVDAQDRIVGAIDRIAQRTPGDSPVGIVSHGAVGALLLSHLRRGPITRRDDQPPGAGGNYFSWLMPERSLGHDWRSIDPVGPG